MSGHFDLPLGATQKDLVGTVRAPERSSRKRGFLGLVERCGGCDHRNHRLLTRMPTKKRNMTPDLANMMLNPQVPVQE